jgi:hypothetical protein
MSLKQTIRKILREEKKTKSTNKEFVKYKDSNFHSLSDYTLQDIVDNWDSLSDHKNDNIKTIKYFVSNPDKITDLVYDEQGLEDGYHRLIAAKILKKPRFTYRMVENLQENIQRIKQIMIKEDKVPLIKKMIDDIGLKNTFKMVGDYDKLDSYLTDSDKIDFIENTIHRLSRELESDFIGLALQEIDEEPIHYSDEDGKLEQIEYLGNKYVDIAIYDNEVDTYLGEYSVRYDSLPTQILDEIFRMLLDK